MLDLTQFFISHAFAQSSDSLPPGGSNTSPFAMFIPFAAILLVFYMLVIRPQQKKFDEQAKMIKALQRGDRVITTGGIYGKITKLDNDEALTLEIADGVQIKVARANVQGLAAKTQPAASADGSEAGKK